LWIPVGNYLLSQKLDVVNDGITFRGAGPWWSVLMGYQIGIFGRWGNPAKNIGLYDFAIIGMSRIRNDGEVDTGVGAAYSNTIVQNLWIEHTKVGMWLDGPFTQLSIIGVTIRNTLADGVNFHIGITNSVVQQSIIRNTADDGLAMWSQNQPDTGNIFKFNTIQVPILANAIAIYGGSDNSATDNYVADSVTMGGGLHAGNRFGAVPLAGTTIFARNTVVRCGAKDDWFGIAATNNTFGGIYFWAQDHPQTGITNVADIELIDCTYEAIGFFGSSVTNVALQNISINGAGTYALREDSAGSASFNFVVATNLKKGGIWNCGQPFTAQIGTGNSGWQDTHCPS